MKRRRPRTQPDAPKKEAGPFFKGSAQPAVQAKDDGFFQPKLTIGQPGDRYEQEADQMADAVVHHAASRAGDTAAVRKKAKIQRMEEEEPQAKLQRQEEEEEAAQPKLQRMEEEEEAAQPKLQRMEEEEPQAKLQMQEEEEEAQPKLQRMEEEEPQAKIQKQEEEEEAAPVQAKAAQAQAQKKPALAQRLAQNKGKGSPLPPKVRQQMESSFETDFAGVRIHTDQEAAQMNQDLSAQAFTHGNDVYFNEGTFSPESSGGKHLLAHELTHVVQQRKK